MTKSSNDALPLRVVVADDHHHILPEIHLAIRQRGLPFEGIHVLHFDAHPDLSFPRCVDPALVFQPAELYDALDESVSGDAKAYSTFVFSLLSLARYSLSDCVLTGAGIAEFLLPLVYAGHVNQITWIKPHWAKQSSSSSNSGCQVLNEAISQLKENSKAYILDVDLDYFSTWNPFRKAQLYLVSVVCTKPDLEQRVGSSIADAVAQVYTKLRYKDTGNAMSVEARSRDRRIFVATMEQMEANDQLFVDPSSPECQSIVSALASLYPGNVNAPSLLATFAALMAGLDEDARQLVWWAGPNLDLPHHLSSSEEIEDMVDAFKDFLVASGCCGNPPSLVTIAKSTGDEYLPPHQLDLVQSLVLRSLAETFGELAIEFVEYQTDEEEGAINTDGK